MFSRLSELYFNFWNKFGVGADIALIILFFLVAYFVIKNAVKNGILMAYQKIENEKKHRCSINKDTPKDNLKDE